MKLIHVMILPIVLLLTVTSANAQSEKKAHQHVSILSMQYEVFYFKIDAEFIGANVQVTDSTGVVFFTTELYSKRSLIDFFYMETGKYTIRFELNGKTEEYEVFLDRKEGASGRAHSKYFKLRA